MERSYLTPGWCRRGKSAESRARTPVRLHSWENSKEFNLAAAFGLSARQYNRPLLSWVSLKWQRLGPAPHLALSRNKVSADPALLMGLCGNISIMDTDFTYGSLIGRNVTSGGGVFSPWFKISTANDVLNSVYVILGGVDYGGGGGAGGGVQSRSSES